MTKYPPKQALTNRNAQADLVVGRPSSSAYGPGPGSESSESDKILQYLRLVWSAQVRWWKVTIPIGIVLASGLGLVLWYAIKPEYVASSVLRIKSRAPRLVYQKEDSSQFVSTQLNLFGTRAVVAPALSGLYKKFPEIAKNEDPFRWVQTNLRVNLVSKSELVRVQFTDTNPLAAKDVVQAVVNSYMTYHRDYGKRYERAMVELLQEEKDRREVTLQELRKNVQKLGRSVAAIHGTDSVQDPLDPMQSIQDLLVRTEVDIEVAKARKHALNQHLNANPVEVSEADLKTYYQTQTGYQDLQKLKKEIAERLSQWEAAFVDPTNSDRYQEMKKQAAEIDEKIANHQAEFKKSGREAILSQLNGNRSQLLRDVEEEILQKEAIRDYLDKKVVRQRGVRGDANADQLELEFAKNELQRHEAVYEQISSRIVTLRTEQFAPARVELVDEAILPTRAVASPWASIGVGCFGALMVPLGFVVLYEFFVQRVTDSARVQEHQVEVLGEIAVLPKYLPTPSQKENAGNPPTLFEESVDHLCNNLRLSPQLSDAQVISVVSAISGEGKTHVSTQLALSLARSSKEPVLLMETDFRSPDISRMLGVETDWGLLDVFHGNCTVNDAIVASVDRNLDVLTSGLQPRDLHALLQKQSIDELMIELRKRYRYIVIDTPPILAAGESLLFTCRSDVALICVRCGYSRMAQMSQVRRRIQKVFHNPIGVVVNGVPKRQYVAAYGQYEYVNA